MTHVGVDGEGDITGRRKCALLMCLPNVPVGAGTMLPIIEQDLGKRVTEVFSSINTTPLASASIAQVRLVSIYIYDSRRQATSTLLFCLFVIDTNLRINTYIYI